MFCFLFISKWDACNKDALNITTLKIKYSLTQKTARSKTICLSVFVVNYV